QPAQEARRGPARQAHQDRAQRRLHPGEGPRMRSLFWRLLVSLWLAMALLVGAFALIHAWAFPSEAMPPRLRGAEMRADNALLCTRLGLEGCDKVLRARDPRDQRVALYRDGQRMLGEPIDGAPALAQEALASPDHHASAIGDVERAATALARDPSYVVVAEGPRRSRWLFFIMPDTLPYRLLAIVLVTGRVAVVLARYLAEPIARLRRAVGRAAPARGGDPGYGVVAEGPRRSRWLFFIMPDTLPYRLLAIVLVTGLVAVVLARYLAEPIARLRRATQQMAAGDLPVRVA